MHICVAICGLRARWQGSKLENTGARFRSASFLVIRTYLSFRNLHIQDMSHIIMLPSAPCSPLLLFPVVDIVLTLVAFMSLLLAQRLALSV